MSVSVQKAPNGMAIMFKSHRPRGYWLMRKPTALKVADEKHPEWGKKLTSVTTVLDVLNKPALKWWGMQIGVEGCLHLVRNGIIRITDDGYEVLNEELLEKLIEAIAEDKAKDLGKLETDTQRLCKLLTFEKMTVNHVTGRAAKRGTTAHNAFETWANTGILPEPSGYIDEQRPYVVALRKFIEENTFEAVKTEVIVASPAHNFGGRYDIRASLNGAPEGIYDVKTSKDIYMTHFIQMEGYEGASVELGYTPTAERAVIHLGRDGEWKMMRSHEITTDGEPVTYEDFLACLRLSRVVDRLGGL